MKRIILSLVVITGILTACSKDDEQVIPKDYGMKTFEANMLYEYIPDPGGGMGQTVYKHQIYFKFGEENAVATGVYDTDSWTQFYLNKDDMSKYNDQTNMTGWDLLFTKYNRASDAYGVTGPLINTKESIKVGLFKYTESDDANTISESFAKLTLSDITSVNEYSGAIDAIADNEWKNINGMPPTYTVNTNYFYIVKLNNGDIYKLRFISFYGSTKSERIIKIEYALMK